jgi:hypothetical protein
MAKDFRGRMDRLGVDDELKGRGGGWMKDEGVFKCVKVERGVFERGLLGNYRNQL